VHVAGISMAFQTAVPGETTSGATEVKFGMGALRNLGVRILAALVMAWGPHMGCGEGASSRGQVVERRWTSCTLAWRTMERYLVT
jgi:hypothetical protein